MNDPSRILKADHREAEKLMKQLAETDEGAKRNSLVEELTKKLTAHMEIEERIVYPLVTELVGAEDEEEAEIEHGLARKALSQLGEMRDKPGFGAAVEMLAGGVGHHVEEEETELLPELKDAMTRDEWLSMGDDIAKAKRAAGMKVPRTPGRRSSKRSSAKKG